MSEKAHTPLLWLRGLDLAEHEANDRLIAAAAEMLDVLKECELFLRLYGLNYPRLAEVAEKARAVIAKAAGN